MFPGFFLGGWESASHIDRSGQRQDYALITQHAEQARADYERARSVGIRCVREGLRWHLCDRGGHYGFGSILPMVEAARDLGVTQILCLLHYGYPDDADPLSASFISRFRDYAAAFAEWRVRRTPAPRWYILANEPSMFTSAAGDAGCFAPFAAGKGDELKAILLAATVAAADAVRAADPEARVIALAPCTTLSRTMLSRRSTGPT